MEGPGMKHAFTLIELLAVLAIVGLLIAVLLPALASARARAQAVHCLVNARMLSMAVFMYADDADGHLPLSSHTTGNAFNQGNWIYTLEYYGVTREGRRCPLDPIARTTSFATSDYLEPTITGGGGWTRLHRIPRPSATGFAAEADPTYLIDHLHSMDWQTANHMLGQVDVERHQGGSHVPYLDGRAAALQWSTLQATFTPERHFLNPETAR